MKDKQRIELLRLLLIKLATIEQSYEKEVILRACNECQIAVKILLKSYGVKLRKEPV